MPENSPSVQGPTPDSPRLSPRELGRIGGKKSGETRRAKKAVRADARAKAAFERSAEELANVLINAALGRGEFSRLDPEKKAQFAQKALEYAVGRPRPLELPVPEETRGPGLVFAPGAEGPKQVEDEVRHSGAE